MPTNACSFSFFIASFRSLALCYVGVSVSDLLRTQQKSLISPSVLDQSDRLECVDQVEAMVVGAD